MGTTSRQVDGWLLIETTPAEERRRVLLLPGWLCTDEIFADLLAEPTLAAAGVRLVAANPPGFKGLPLTEGCDATIPAYADLLERLAARERPDVILGHSYFANVCIELAARGTFAGPLVLVSPSLRRAAEPGDSRTLDRLLRVPGLGALVLRLAYAGLESLFSAYFTPETRHRLKAVVAEARRFPRPIARRLITGFFDDLRRHGDLTPRLAASRNPVWYVRGEQDNIKLPEDARAALTASGHVTFHDVPGSKHFVMIDRPAALAEVLRAALA
jgi:pimeloyl-ACP methyl ester carboxylesterase